MDAIRSAQARRDGARDGGSGDANRPPGPRSQVGRLPVQRLFTHAYAHPLVLSNIPARRSEVADDKTAATAAVFPFRASRRLQLCVWPSRPAARAGCWESPPRGMLVRLATSAS